MIVEIEFGGWEHECCGDEIRHNDLVDWTYAVDSDGVRQQTHHDTGAVTTRLSGRVARIDLIVDGDRVAIDRVPSGAALCGQEDGDDCVVVRLTDDSPLRLRSATRFIVGVQTA